MIPFILVNSLSAQQEENIFKDFNGVTGIPYSDSLDVEPSSKKDLPPSVDKEGSIFIGYQQEFGSYNELGSSSYLAKVSYYPVENISLNYYLGARYYSNNDLEFHFSSGPHVGLPFAVIGLGGMIIGEALDWDDEEEEDCLNSYSGAPNGFCDTYDPSDINFDPNDPDCHDCEDETDNLGEHIPNAGAGMFLFGVITTVIPEEIEFHQPISDKLTISPFVSVGGLDCVQEKEKNKLRWNYGGGVRLNIFNKKYSTFSIHGAYKGVLGVGHGVQYGASFGVGI